MNSQIIADRGLGPNIPAPKKTIMGHDGKIKKNAKVGWGGGGARQHLLLVPGFYRLLKMIIISFN